DPNEFLHALKTDLFANEIYVFTPKGELKRLPAGSTPIDFAYAVHTDVGSRCEAARVNGRLVPLDHRLGNADRVEILTGARAEPSGKWLATVRSSRARQKIRQWLRTRTREQEESSGREALKRELRRRRIVFPREERLGRIAEETGRDSVRNLYADIARGRVTIASIVERLAGAPPDRAPEEMDVERLRDMVRRPVRGIRMAGIDNILVSFARCCQPVPGDPIIGIVTRGRGVSVHRSNCPNVEVVREPGRLAEVEWDVVPGQRFLVSLVVNARDREGLVAEISRRVQELGTEVRSGRFEIHEGEFSLVLVVAIDDLGHLQRVVREIEAIDSVLSVTRAV
ncbi:MAG: bifunctional (p)ppGpp synthetase/guanosine-3',5'-bis(diphosphate) 3'-pyrophosphohydrolase, partial [Candidatus Krumholzibacteriota bacterium]|nr:bifunctional (p)ppGpp synthetase/guanosine-3',5'-bis(diphosphate) 3'-pyrophosphohydrolase [Candidatus Krumholzibacteriota bacterium]